MSKLLYINTLRDEADYRDFHTSINKALENLGTTLRKKLLLCSIELIQNNLIHNTNRTLEYSLFEDGQEYVVQTCFHTDLLHYRRLSSFVGSVNSLTEAELGERYLTNLQKPITSDATPTHNGFLLCRRKSGHAIGLIHNDLGDEIEVKLILKFDKR